VNRCSVPWVKAFTSAVPARSKLQALACRQLPSSESNQMKKKKYENEKKMKKNKKWTLEQQSGERSG